MDQQASFPYDQLHGLSFTQLFSVVVAMARWNWILHRNESLVLLRIREGERMRRLQPAYGALGSASTDSLHLSGQRARDRSSAL